ncbi:MAG: branched-chain amino acid transporter AzlC [Erysipelotrichaceae bacterium]|nr:branched-chain amino acid transporter AzlC [Erysipelotrichaceae bacterium]
MNKTEPAINQVKKAFVTSIPVMAGYIVLGIGFGILLREAGYGALWAFAMSLFIYAGSLQYVGVSLISSSASVLTALITSIMVNARHLFYSISMLEKYRNAGKYKPYMIFSLTDETYSLLSTQKVPEGCDEHFYCFMVSLFNHSYWIFGSVLGSLIGRSLPFSSEGIEFSMTALFAASFVEQWLSTKDHRSALCGLCSSLLCLLVFGPADFLIPSMILITLVLSFMGKGEVQP